MLQVPRPEFTGAQRAKVLREDLQQNQIPSETWPAARRESQEDSMNRVFLVMVVSALLVTLGLAQTPDAGSNTAPANVKGCLGGSEGNYTVVEDGTRQTFKITTSSVDLKAHLGHDVKLIGHKAGAAAGPGAADNSFAVTELSMISEHCAAAAAAAAATVIPPAETVIAPDPAPATTASAPAPAPVAPAVTASVPSVEAAAPVATVAPSAAVAGTPAVEPAVPAVTVAVAPPPAPPATPAVEAAATAEPSPSTPASEAEAAAPVANDTHPARLSAHARKLAAAKAAAATEAAEPVTPTPEPAAAPAAEAATPATAVSPAAETVAAPDTAAPDAAVPAPAATHRTGSLALLVGFVVVVIVLGTTAPLIGRWRKRKALERDGSPNLSFTHDSNGTEVTTNEATTNEAASGRDKAGPRKVA
jgi:hypothetical protein